MNIRALIGWTVVAAAFAGCGELRSADHLGEPLWVMQADLQGAALGEPEGVHRGLFGWLSFGEGAWFDCLEAGRTDCSIEQGFEHHLLLMDTEVRPTFASGLEVPFYELPDPARVASRRGSVSAIGGIGIYDDRNGNGELDPLSPGETKGVDRVLAESLTMPFARSLAVYVQGPLHPIWHAFDELYGCPEPPQGFSVGRVSETGECQISPVTRLLITASSDQAAARTRCGLSAESLAALLKSDKPMPLPANAVVHCWDLRNLEFYVDNGNECDPFNITEYKLNDQPPPEWWPCR